MDTQMIFDLKLTDDAISRISLGDKSERFVRDSRDTGFAIRLRRRTDGTIRRTFCVIYEVSSSGKRKRRKLFIGDHPTFSSEDARDEARKLLQAVAKGDDPRAERQDKKTAITLSDFIENTYFKDSEFTNLKASTKQGHLGRIKRYIIPKFGDFKIRDITFDDIKSWHSKGKDRPYDANRCLSLMSKLMSVAIDKNHRKDNPCRGAKKHKEKARDRYLDEYELRKFLKELGINKTPYGEIIRFLTITGWRIGEAISLKWEFIDLSRKIAVLPDTKTGQQTRALSLDAISILQNQKHQLGFVFSNRNGLAPLGYKHIRLALIAICENADIEKIRPHDLRHTAATWAAIAGASSYELRETFGWSSLSMTERYVERAERLGRKGSERIASAINIFGDTSEQDSGVNS